MCVHDTRKKKTKRRTTHTKYTQTRPMADMEMEDDEAFHLTPSLVGQVKEISHQLQNADTMAERQNILVDACRSDKDLYDVFCRNGMIHKNVPIKHWVSFLPKLPFSDACRNMWNDVFRSILDMSVWNDATWNFLMHGSATELCDEWSKDIEFVRRVAEMLEQPSWNTELLKLACRVAVESCDVFILKNGLDKLMYRLLSLRMHKEQWTMLGELLKRVAKRSPMSVVYFPALIHVIDNLDDRALFAPMVDELLRTTGTILVVRIVRESCKADVLLQTFAQANTQVKQQLLSCWPTRVASALGCDCPKDPLDVVIASDGNVYQRDEILGKIASRVVEFNEWVYDVKGGV